MKLIERVDYNTPLHLGRDERNDETEVMVHRLSFFCSFIRRRRAGEVTLWTSTDNELRLVNSGLPSDFSDLAEVVRDRTHAASLDVLERNRTKSSSSSLCPSLSVSSPSSSGDGKRPNHCKVLRKS